MTDNANWVKQNVDTFGSQVSSAVLFAHAFADPLTWSFFYRADEFVPSTQANL